MNRDAALGQIILLRYFIKLDPEESVYLNEKQRPQSLETLGRCFGGGMWGSNPPRRLFAVRTGFEDREAHQHPSAPIFSLRGPAGAKKRPGRSLIEKFQIQAAEVPLPEGNAAAVTGFQEQHGVFPGGAQGVPQLRQGHCAVGGA